ncbi:MAG: hypothetical protein R2699_10605 [Acidimicrobiales bacterium]
MTQAARELFGNIPPGVSAPDVWSLQNPIAYTFDLDRRHDPRVRTAVGAPRSGKR